MYPFNVFPPTPPEQHIHYHYHYHYDDQKYDERSISPRYSTAGRSKSQLRGSPPRTYSSSIEPNYWKTHVNPQVSKLYDNFQTRKSRFSQNPNKITEEDSMIEETPKISKKMLETECEENTTFGQRRALSKLESLYFAKKSIQKQRNIHEIESVTNQTEDPFCAIHEQKLRRYRKQVERLKRYEQECVYLRDHFMLHIEAKHRQQL